MNTRVILSIIYRLAVNIIALGLAVTIFKHASADSFSSLVVAAILLAVCNFFIKPILTFISIPFLVMTLGLFYFIINGAVVLFVAWAVPSFHVDGLWTAIGMSIIISIINFIFDAFYIDRGNDRDYAE